MNLLYTRRRRRHALILPSSYPTGLVGWSSAALEQYADAAAVGSLTNQKDGSVWGSQGTASAKPTFRVSGINGKRAVQYGGDDYLDMPAGALSWFQNVTGFTWIALIQLTSTSGTKVIQSWSTNSSGGANRCSVLVDASSKWAMHCTRLDAESESSLASSVAADTNPHVLHCMTDFASGHGRIWLDGELIASSDSFVSTGSTSNTTSDRARIGGNATSTPGLFASAKLRHTGAWAAANTATDFAPMGRSWCQDGGIAYAGV